MEFTITTRHFEPMDEIRSSVERKVKNCVEKYFSRGVSHVTVSMESNRYVVEIDIKIKGISFHARKEMHDLNGAVDATVEKIETQMRRYKERRKNHKQKERL